MTPAGLSVIHCDNHLLVVVKPAGVPIQADASGDPDLLSIARAWVKQEFDKPGDAFLGMVHRLDRPAHGVVVFARTSKAASRLAAQFAARTVAKAYQAVVHGAPEPAEATLCDWLATGAGSTRVGAQGWGQRAELTYRVEGCRGGRALVSVDLHTGRKHQIRCQLGHRGWPIDGDLRYGAPAPLAGRAIALWARSVAVYHPTNGARLTFAAPIPSGWPWRFGRNDG